MPRTFASVLLVCLFAVPAAANPPIAQYLFPAGGQRGTTVDIRVGGIDLNKRCNFELLGPGVEASKQLDRTHTTWFEGPLLHLPESQQQEDYPKDMAGKVKIAADAAPGVRHARVWTSQGASPALRFMVGELPEIIEREIDGEAIPVEVKLPVTINGRIFPRQDIDIWSFEAKRGQTVWCEVYAARVGSPLDSLLQVVDPHGKVIAENDDTYGADSFLRFTASEDGKHQVRIRDVNFRGGQAFVYRLTISSEPRVDRIYPLGGKRGSTTHFELTGSGLAQTALEIPIPADAAGDFAHRGQWANSILLDTDDLPEIVAAEVKPDPAKAPLVQVPAVLNGRIGKACDCDPWAFAMKKGETLEFDLRARRLGSPLNGVLVVSDATGKELARADNTGGPQPDPRLRFTAPAEGTFRICVSERFRGRGGPEFAYRLRVAPPESPGFRLQLVNDSLAVERGKTARLRITVERLGGLAGAIQLTADGLPEGVTLTNPTINANQQGNIDLVFKATETAPIRATHVTLTGTAKAGDRNITAKAVFPGERGQPPLDHVQLAVALLTPFQVKGEHDFRWAPRGTVHSRKYQLVRTGYDGPIEVSVADRQARHLQGVTAGTVTVPAGATEFEFPITLPPWMEMGRTCRICVTASATIKDKDGSEHLVSFSSVQQNEQLIVVVGPERVSLQIEKASVLVAPNQKIDLPLRITRGKDLAGEVKIELVLPAHVKDVHAEPVTIAADKTSAVLSLRFGAKPRPFNMPAFLRATLVQNGKPVITETKLELLTD
jgi:hypothetical protein